MSGTPWLFRMRWVDLLFMHWPVPADALRPLIPAGLELDTYDGRAWLGVVPFGMEGVAPRFLPAPPGPGAFPELNVRTYVRRRGRGRGVVPEPGRRQSPRRRGCARRLPPAVLPGPDVVDDRGRLGRVPLRARGPSRPVGGIRQSVSAGRARRAGAIRFTRGVPDRSVRAVCRGRCRAALVDSDPPRTLAAPAGRGRDRTKHDGSRARDRAAGRRAAAPFRETARRRRLVAAASRLAGTAVAVAGPANRSGA